MRSFLPILSAVLFTIACGASTPRTRIEIPMVESWFSRPVLLILDIPPPEYYGIQYANPRDVARMRVSLLHRSGRLALNTGQTPSFEPIWDGAVSDTPWIQRLQPRVPINIQRFMTEGMIGIEPVSATGERHRITSCPDDLLNAGYLSGGDTPIVLLRTTQEAVADPMFGCLFRLSPRT